MRSVIKYHRNFTMVDPSGGCDYTTIQAALTAAVANEQIVALGGTDTNPDDAIVLKMSWRGWFWE